MLIKRLSDIRPSEITPYAVFRDRRRFLKAAALAVGGAALGPKALSAGELPSGEGAAFDDLLKSPFSTVAPPTSYEAITTYNNFYEFGLGKGEPAENAQRLKTDPWSVEIAGECETPGTFTLEDILAPHAFEERIYRLRCVEAWSMVVPWVGIPLADVLKRFKPTSKAKYVAFETFNDPEVMATRWVPVTGWPYREGLRIDEAMNPLALLAVGLYGKVLPNQNGAPLRLVVPWKYGFKSIKSIVTIRFQEDEPVTTWSREAPNEYGFYANVNPEVDHPRWSQARERPVGEGLFAGRKETLMFNGYGEQVASLYSGMDLHKQF